MLQTVSLQDVAVGVETISAEGKATRTPAVVAGALLGDVTKEQLIATIFRSNPNPDDEVPFGGVSLRPALQQVNIEAEEE